MTSLKQWFVLTIFSALACSGLNAQIVNMRANIPFDFHAGDKVMPAGEYQIHGEGTWVTVHPVNGGKPVTTFTTISAVGADPNRAAQLDFQRYGDTYFLKAIWKGHSADGRELVPEASEKKLAKQAKPARTVILVASR